MVTTSCTCDKSIPSGLSYDPFGFPLRTSVALAGPAVNILLLAPAFPDTFWSFKHALTFIGRRAANPPLGLLTVAALLPRTWSKRLVDLDVIDLTDAHLAWADYVFVGAMVVQRESAGAA